MIDDEITSDYAPDGRRQEELVREFCGGINQRIRSARTREEAERIVQETCSRFDQSCESDVIRSFLKKHVIALCDDTWSHRP
jgi:hypothetical protein